MSMMESFSPSFFVARKVKKMPSHRPFFFSFVSLLFLLCSFAAMASLTPPPWRLKIITSLETRLLVALEAPAATVGELRGEKKEVLDATAREASSSSSPFSPSNDAGRASKIACRPSLFLPL
jgi:hypothetical protein